MNTFWEIADEDISLIVACHKSSATLAAARASLNEGEVTEAVNQFSDFADQVAAASCCIEDQLMRSGLIPSGRKRFESPTPAI
ncbi:MAG TPA: hypothetical protein PLN52_04020 [Opitutaceae bacterium]|nr:hypothetical protein [Opitutaceae bacterium]